MSALNDLEKSWYERDLGQLITEGRVYGAFVSNSSVASGEDLSVVMVIGDKPAAIRLINLVATDIVVAFSIHRSPSYTGGAPLQKFNLNDIVGVTGDENVTFVNSSIVVTDKGEIMFGPWNIYSENLQTITRQIDTPLLLKPNTTYLITINNPAGSPTQMSIAINYVDH